jgi:hypothetical protein
LLTPVRRVWGLLLVALVLLAGCKVDARVGVTLRADGSGTVVAIVTLDADAVHRLTAHKPLDQALPLADLRDAGWKVTTVAVLPRTDPGYKFIFAHAFVGQADLARRISDLVGTTGVLNDPRIERTRGWFGSRDKIAVNVDLTHLTTGIRSDAQITKALTNAGVDVSALDAQLRSELGRALTLTVAVQAPGGQTKTVRLAAGKQATVSAATAQSYTRRMVLLVIGVSLLVLALFLMAASLASRSRRRRTT